MTPQTTLLLFVAAIAVACLAVPIADEDSHLAPSPVHTVENGPNGWKISQLEDKTQPLTVTLVLRKQNLEALAETALAVSTPGSPRYGKFLTAQEVLRLTPVVDGGIATVTKWLRTEEIDGEIDELQGHVRVTAPVHKLETIFQTTFHSFTHPTANLQATRAKAYSLPETVEPLVSAVFGVTGLPLPVAGPIVMTSNGASTPYKVTPSVIKRTYNVSGVEVSRSDKPRQAVPEFQGQVMSKEDLKRYFDEFVPDAKQGDDEVDKFVGPTKDGHGVEAELDIQYIMGPAAGIKTEFWTYLNVDFCADLKNWTTMMLADSDLPSVHSVSYGWQGNLTTIGCHDTEVDDVDSDFQRLASLGVSIIFSSGDSGSAFKPGKCSSSTYLDGTKLEGELIDRERDVSIDDCCSLASENSLPGWAYDSLLKECLLYAKVTSQSSSSSYTSGYTKDNSGGLLWASWPASSPWVTAVGATRFVDQDPDQPEMATDQFGSGGGFSRMFLRPSWQSEDVSEYFTKVDPASLPPKSMYPAEGRGTPDVSGLGEGYQVVVSGQTQSVGGTSASAPMFASLVSLLNEARSQNGKGPLGYLNPFIYKNKDCFRDVTLGTAKVTRSGQKMEYGFDCAEGWDPATGLGTPNFAALLTAALNQP